MTDYTALLLASFLCLPEDAPSTTAPAGSEMTRQSASDIVVRASLSPAEQYRVLALPYPVEDWIFWRVLTGLGVTREYLMDRMGASP